MGNKQTWPVPHLWQTLWQKCSVRCTANVCIHVCTVPSMYVYVSLNHSDLPTQFECILRASCRKFNQIEWEAERRSLITSELLQSKTEFSFGFTEMADGDIECAATTTVKTNIMMTSVGLSVAACTQTINSTASRRLLQVDVKWNAPCFLATIP